MTARKAEPAPSAVCFTYLLRCSDGSYYCGWTPDLKKRLSAHSSCVGSKYTRSRLPVVLVWYESFPTQHLAMRRECEIKRLTHAQKDALVQSHSCPQQG